MSNFWQELKKPFLVLAPMEDVTDYVFREIVCDLAKPDVLFTEFTSADGLFYKSNDRAINKLKYSPRQRPIVAQIWGNNPDTIYKAAEKISQLGFDGIDVNCGCPVRNVVKKQAGAGLIGNYKKMKEIIKAVREGAPTIPMSIKTRYKNKSTTTEEWMEFLLEQKPDALIVHGRTPEQLSKGMADWEELAKISEMKNRISPDTIFIGNGDVKSYKVALEKHELHKVDGVMIGRGIFYNPWVFEKSIVVSKHAKQEYIDILMKHMDLFEKTWGKRKNFAILKKFFKIYVKDFPGANVMRDTLMRAKTSSEVKSILNP